MLMTRSRYGVFISISILFLTFVTYYLRSGISSISIPIIQALPDGSPPPERSPEPYHPKYLKSSTIKSPPIVDNFPLAAAAHSAADLPPIPSWNIPPSPHVPESTPLFIGFTRNWRLLQQVVVSYITAGWPPEDIYVVENTGVMDSNKNALLSLQNPFFLNYTRLHLLGVNVVITPTLLTFAQLQNFYIWHATQQGWGHFYWSHMDLVVLTLENEFGDTHPDILPPSEPKHNYTDLVSVYSKCVSVLRDVLTPDPLTQKPQRWAQRFFSYDRLALVNVEAFLEVGAWDTMIPFYMTDCDMHARLEMAGYVVQEVPVGLIYDVAGSLDDLIVLYRKVGEGVPEVSWKDPNVIEEQASKESEKSAEDEVRAGKRASPPNNDTRNKSSSSSSSSSPSPKPWTEDSPSSSLFAALLSTLGAMTNSKGSSPRGRNTWQARQSGGQGEPFYRSPSGFETGIQMTIEHGKRVFAEKWGHRDCDIRPIGLQTADMWAVGHDWEVDLRTWEDMEKEGKEGKEG